MTAPPLFGIVAEPVKRVFVLALGVVASAAACSGSPSTSQRGNEGLSILPRLTGKTLDGEYVGLDDYRGQVVLLNVWATWCAPCRQELPELRALHERWSKDGFTVIGVSIDTSKDAAKVGAMARQFRLDYPILLDPLGKSIEALDVHGYPTSFVVGRGGEMLWRRDGLIQPGDAELENQIRAAVRAPAKAP